ncbi:MAG: cupin domain-containing protein [Nitrospira sp.]|nr:cupin domain-containing protein [Nitrospira sp.]
MHVVKLKDCPEFLAGDHTLLRELLHPGKATVALGFSLAHGLIKPGAKSKRHRLASSEVYYFLAGKGRFRIDQESADIEAGSVVYVPPKGQQWVENTGTANLEFLCLVDPAWKPEDETVTE